MISALRDIQLIENDTYMREITTDGSADFSLWKATEMHIVQLKQEDRELAKNCEQKYTRFTQDLEGNSAYLSTRY